MVRARISLGRTDLRKLLRNSLGHLVVNISWMTYNYSAPVLFPVLFPEFLTLYKFFPILSRSWLLLSDDVMWTSAFGIINCRVFLLVNVKLRVHERNLLLFWFDNVLALFRLNIALVFTSKTGSRRGWLVVVQQNVKILGSEIAKEPRQDCWGQRHFVNPGAGYIFLNRVSTSSCLSRWDGPGPCSPFFYLLVVNLSTQQSVGISSRGLGYSILYG